MSGIDNNFVNRFVQARSGGFDQRELVELKRMAQAGTITPEAAQRLRQEIGRDGQIDQEEQKALQAIGQGARDQNTLRTFQQSIDPTNSGISRMISVGFQNKARAAQQTPPLNVQAMDSKDKVIEAFKRSFKYMGPELQQRVASMFTEDNLKLLAGGLVLYGASHAAGVGFIADGLLALGGAVALGSDALDVMGKLYDFAAGSINARSEADIERAAQRLASGVATVVSDIPAVLGMRNMRVTPRTSTMRFPGMGPSMMTTAGAIARADAVVTVTYPAISLTRGAAAATGATVLMARGNGNGGGRVSQSGGSGSPQPTPRTGPHGSYEDAPYHSSRGNAVKSKKPIDGQAALDNSVPLGGNSRRRLAFVNNEIVVLDQTSPGKFHGHVRTWAELENDMKQALVRANLFRPNGRPVR